MDSIVESANALGPVGLIALALVIAVFLALKAVETIRRLIDRKNGNDCSCTPKFDELRLICPIATGNVSLEDVRDVLLDVKRGIDAMNNGRTEQRTRDGELARVLGELRVEVATLRRERQ